MLWLHRIVDTLLELQHLRLPALIIVLVGLVGAVGYHQILDLSLVDSVYQSVLTLSTVGFREVVEFNDEAKLFTAGLIVVGVSAVFYTITLLAATVVEGELRRNLRQRVSIREIRSMKNHYIVCGYGRVGEEIVEELSSRNSTFVIVDNSDEECERARKKGFHVLQGDAQDGEILEQAGIRAARCLLVSTTSDAANTYIILTARDMNHDLYIVARSETPLSAQKLKLAGAHRIVSPYSISGKRMALSALQPMMTDFMDALAMGRHGELLIAEFDVIEGSSLDGAPLADCFDKEQPTTVLGIVRLDGRLVVGPRGSELLHAGDTVIVMAEEEGIAGLVARQSV